MQDSLWIRQGAKNLALLVLIFIPLFLLLAGLFATISGTTSSSDLVGDASVLYPGVLGPILLGELVYLSCLFVVVRRARTNARLLAVALTPLIAIGFIPFGVGFLLTSADFVIAFAVALVVYGLLVRIPKFTT